MKIDEQETRRINLHIDLGEEADDEELDRATRELRSELMELNVDSVELVKSGKWIEGTKSAEVVTLGSLAVVLLPMVIPKLLEYLQSWSLRAENRKVSIKTQIGDRSIELDYNPATVSQDELQKLVRIISGALVEKPDTDSER